MFTCTALGGVPSEYSFRWFNGSVEVMSGDSVRITSDGTTSTLMLTVGPDDFVNYTCSVSNTFTEALESIVLVEACKWCCHDDTYQTELTDIECSQLVKCLLRAQVTWHTYLLSLILHYVSLALSFPDAPEAAILDSQKPTVTFSEGVSGVLRCTATGVPAPTISWFRNGVLLSSDDVTFVISSSTDATMSLLSVTSTLNVTSVMRESAFATITCSASNGVGANSSDSTQLILLCKMFVL